MAKRLHVHVSIIHRVEYYQHTTEAKNDKMADDGIKIDFRIFC